MSDDANWRCSMPSLIAAPVVVHPIWNANLLAAVSVMALVANPSATLPADVENTDVVAVYRPVEEPLSAMTCDTVPLVSTAPHTGTNPVDTCKVWPDVPMANRPHVLTPVDTKRSPAAEGIVLMSGKGLLR